ncbi:MAG TPA: hypothetical protein VGJ56_06875 [Reyranella sp.]
MERITQAEHERIVSLIEAGRRSVTERDAIVADSISEQSRLVAERDAAVERAASAAELANVDRRQLEQERDRARTERDDLANEVDVALRELDSEARHTLGDIEKIFAATGVDPRLGRPTMHEIEARREPYIPGLGFEAAGAETACRFEGVARRFERLKALREACSSCRSSCRSRGRCCLAASASGSMPSTAWAHATRASTCERLSIRPSMRPVPAR